MRRVLTGFLLAGLGLLVWWAGNVARGQEAAPANPLRRIEVQGLGEVTVPANELVQLVELVTAGDDFGALKRRNDALLKQLADLLTAQKIEHPPLQTTVASFDFTPAPTYGPYQGQKGNTNNFKAPANQIPKNVAPNDPFGGKDDDDAPAKQPMRMSRRVTLHFKDLDQATNFLAKLTELEAVHKTREIQLSPLQSSLRNQEGTQIKARALAVEQARRKAKELAEASELQLGPALSITDDSSTPRFRPAFPSADPFGSYGRDATMPELDERSTQRTFVALQTDPSALSAEAPPGQVVVSVAVRIVFEARPLK